MPVLACCILISLVSCATDELPVFDTTISNIYFEWAKEGRENYSQTLDSIDVTFALELPSVTDTIINVPVKILGYTSEMDRDVNISVVTSGTTAVEGVHYEIPSSVVMPADSVRAYVPVTLKRDASLKDGIVSLKFQLVENEYFKTAIFSTEEYYNVNRELSFTEFEISFSDILTKPAYWNRTFDGYLGNWTAKKVYLIAELAGVSVEKLTVTPSIQELFAFTRILRDHLKAQQLAGTPVLEDDGTEMAVGPYAALI